MDTKLKQVDVLPAESDLLDTLSKIGTRINPIDWQVCLLILSAGLWGGQREEREQLEKGDEKLVCERVDHGYIESILIFF